MEHHCIRAASIDDLADICERWWRLLDHQGPSGDGAPKNPKNEAAAMDFLRNRILRGQIHVAEIRRNIVGIASVAVEISPLEGSPVIWNIADLWVDENSRQIGVGRGLVRYCEQRAADQGAEEVRLTVHPNNEGATEFYQRLGYNIQLLRLTKRLAGGHQPPS